MAAATDAPPQRPKRRRTMRVADVLVPLLSVVAALAFWELLSRAGVIAERDLPSMSSTFNELWNMVQTQAFWAAFGQTVRGWAIGLVLATVLAVPIGIALGSSEFAARAFRVPDRVPAADSLRRADPAALPHAGARA